MEERRAFERYPVVVGSDVAANGTEISFGLTQDLSRGGARLLTQGKYAAGSRLNLQIHIDKSNVIKLTATVIRAVAVTDRGMWQNEIGVRFDELLADDLVNTLRELASKLGW